MWFNGSKRPKKPPGSRSNKLTGGQELYECTIQCEVKNILYAFVFSCVHFSVLFCFVSFFFFLFFILESTKKVEAECAGHHSDDASVSCFIIIQSSEDLTH